MLALDLRTICCAGDEMEVGHVQSKHFNCGTQVLGLDESCAQTLCPVEGFVLENQGLAPLLAHSLRPKVCLLLLGGVTSVRPKACLRPALASTANLNLHSKVFQLLVSHLILSASPGALESVLKNQGAW